MIKRINKYLLTSLKGMGMGAADVVPGVSGGTIAFITGIYEELVHAIRSFDSHAVRFFFTGKWRSFWRHINGSFLIAVFTGVLISVVSLAQILEHLLTTYPTLIWSFFFGLIVASSLIVARKIDSWNYTKVVALMAGVGTAFYITSITPAQTTESAWFIFIAGALASCAMILPGISGSFILLLLGKYQFALNAVNELELFPLLLLLLGAVAGLISFAKLLSWLLKKFHDVTVAVLAGFMIGSLNKIWPWKKTVSTIMIEGHEKPLLEKNIIPTPGDPSNQFWEAIALMAAGIVLITAIELVSRRLGNNPEANRTPDES